MESHRSMDTTPADPLAETQPTYPKEPLSDYQPVRIEPSIAIQKSGEKRRRSMRCGCLVVSLLLVALLVLAAYLFLPPRTNVILLGIDDRLPGAAVGRSDTIILVTFQPIRRSIGMLSIPRDLWVQVPGYGENRINTAHFFAEAQQSGSGPGAVKDTIQVNFGVEVQYYVRMRFDNFMEIVDATGGVEIQLAEAMAGYPAGTHRLNSEQALAFVRDRSGADDFSRMGKAQILLRSLLRTAVSLENIPHWPEMARIGFNAVETDIPVFFWPKLGISLLLSGANGIDTRSITREMVRPFTTNQGAQVLEPRWELIQPLVQEMFGR